MSAPPGEAAPRPRRPAGAAFARVALALGSLALVLLVAELGWRSLLDDAWRVWPPGLERRFDPDPALVPGVAGPSRFTTNEIGVRGDPWNPRARHHVLAIGGSTTICIYLDDSEAWPHRVQAILNARRGPDHAWVGNVGRPGHTSAQNVLQLEKLLAQHPQTDTVVAMLGGNDFLIHLLMSTRRPDSLSGGAARDPSPASGPHTALARAFSRVPLAAEAPWYRRSALLRSLLDRLAGDRARAHPALLDKEGRFYASARASRRAASAFRDALPDLGVGKRAFADNLERMLDLAEDARVRLVLVTQPSLWDADLGPRERDLLWTGGPPADALRPGQEYYSAAALARGMAAYNDVLRAVCARRRGECVDAARHLSGRPAFFYDDLHLTEAGAAGLAERIAGALLAPRRGGGRPRAHS